MEKRTSPKVSSRTVKLVVLGASVAALAATAYFFFGPKGKKHQQHAKAWIIKMKGDVVEKLEMAKEMSKPLYDEIIDSVAAQYTKQMKAKHQEIGELASDLKKHWKTISQEARSQR